MAFGFVSGGLFLLCAVACALPGSKNALQQSSRLPQAPTVVECKAQSLVVSVDIPPSGSAPRFEAIDATGAYPVTERYGAQCGYTYSVQPLLGHVDLRASYFSCHTGNQNDEVFTFMFGVFTIDESGKESSFNVSKTCSVPPFSPRVVTCEENYMEVSVRTDLPCPTAGSIKDFSASLALAQSSAVEAWQVMLQKEGQQPEVMSVEYAATLGYIIMVTPGRLVFRTTFGQLYASVKMVNGAAVEVIQATVFFRQNWMVVMVDLVATCSLVKGSSDDSRLHWRTPAERTPPAVGPSKLRTEYMGMGVSGGVANEWAMTDQGYSVTVGKGSVAHRLPSVAEGGIRKNQQGVVTKPKVVRQMATPPVPRPPLSVNRTWRTPAERTPLAVGTSELWGENRRMGVSGGVVNERAMTDRGYSVTVGKETVSHRFPSVAEVGIRKNQQGVVTKPNVVLQMATPPVPRPPLSVNHDGSRLHWRTPAERTPLAFGPSKLRKEYMGMGVSGGVVDERAATDRGYSMTVGKATVVSSIPSAAEGGIRKNQQGVVTNPNVVRQMANTPVPRPPLSVNQSPSGTWRSPAERTPLAVGTSELWGENRRMGASGGVVDKWAASDRGYSVTVGKETVAHRFPSVAEGGIRKNQQGVVIKPNVVRQIANPPVPRPPLSVNQSPSGTWRSPAERTPLAVGTSELRGENMGMGVSGGVVDERATIDRGYSITVGKATVGSSILSPAEGGIRKDQHGVVTKPNVVKQMASPPIPLPFSVNQTNLEERVFHVYLGNIPSDVELVSVELNGQEISVLTAAQMGYSISRVSEGNATSAYIIRVPFEDQFVAKQYVSAGLFEYSLEIKWTLNIRPQMEAYYHLSSVSALVVEALPPVFDSMCTESGISFEKDHQQYDYLWDIAIGSYTLTPQLASERGYILTNDSTTLILAVPLFTIGYVYEDITLQQFYGTFKLLTRNAKTLEIEQSSAKRCLFQTTELLVCSTEGVMTIVTDITKAVPSADPARTTLLDQSCRPQETDDTRVLFSFGLNTCGTRFQIDQQYVTYENELVFHELYSTDSRPVITRDAAYRVTMRCIYPVRDTESLFVDRKFRAETPGIGQIKDPVKVPPQMLKPMQLPKQAIMKPSFQGSVARKPTEYVRVGQWSVPQDKYAQRSLGA
ncbi:zona pellucida protein AX 4 isoform X2 [Carassius gibelio]|uniref:zona pellucida protein AX 4 isoform X2 n=1 Tax=Carassius gibelio TaxID=101364 RepID=UPI002277F9D9|nr:zona pellucida protein AX 4 isoform X2 [Carassius gibelio]